MRDSDENSLLLETDSLQGAVLSSLLALSLTPQSNPVQLYYFYSPFVAEKTVAGRSYPIFLVPQIHWLAELGLQSKFCLTPEPTTLSCLSQNTAQDTEQFEILETVISPYL